MFKLAHAAQRMNATSPLMAGVRRISSIPYHPALALGQIANQEVLDYVTKKSVIYGPVDAKADALNEMFTARRSLDGTIKELASMKITPDAAMLEKKAELDQKILEDTLGLAKARFDATIESIALPAPAAVQQSIESPINFSGTQITYGTITPCPHHPCCCCCCCCYFPFWGHFSRISQRMVMMMHHSVTAPGDVPSPCSVLMQCPSRALHR